MKKWNPPDHWLKVTTIDAHIAGEPFRVITGGFPDLPGDTILARRRHMQNHLDHLRTALIQFYSNTGNIVLWAGILYDCSRHFSP